MLRKYQVCFIKHKCFILKYEPFYYNPAICQGEDRSIYTTHVVLKYETENGFANYELVFKMKWTKLTQPLDLLPPK